MLPTELKRCFVFSTLRRSLENILVKTFRMILGTLLNYRPGYPGQQEGGRLPGGRPEEEWRRGGQRRVGRNDERTTSTFNSCAVLLLLLVVFDFRCPRRLRALQLSFSKISILQEGFSHAVIRSRPSFSTDLHSDIRR